MLNTILNIRDSLDHLDVLIQTCEVNGDVEDPAKVIEILVTLLNTITNSASITKYIGYITENTQLSYMQYSILLDIVKLLRSPIDEQCINQRVSDIEVKLKYVEDTTGHKKYTSKEISDHDIGDNLSDELSYLISNTGIRTTLIIIRALLTFRRDLT